jgi:hypothetical protein
MSRWDDRERDSFVHAQEHIIANEAALWLPRRLGPRVAQLLV